VVRVAGGTGDVDRGGGWGGGGVLSKIKGNEASIRSTDSTLAGKGGAADRSVSSSVRGRWSHWGVLLLVTDG